jgi:hypothetical protein
MRFIFSFLVALGALALLACPARAQVITGGGEVSIQSNGVAQPKEKTLNFLGNGVSVADNPSNGRLDIAISGLGTSGLADPGGNALVSRTALGVTAPYGGTSCGAGLAMTALSATGGSTCFPFIPGSRALTLTPGSGVTVTGGTQDLSADRTWTFALDYTGGQAASGSTKGFLTAADWTTFNAKQAALGFTPENVANKSTIATLGTSDTLYPTQNAVKSYVDTVAATKGTVSSVGLTMPAEFSVSGTPVTTTGTLAVTKAPQAPNLGYFSPNGAAGVPTFRALVAADLPATAVTPGAYTSANITVDAQGRLTAASNGSGGGGPGLPGGLTGDVQVNVAGVLGADSGRFTQDTSTHTTYMQIASIGAGESVLTLSDAGGVPGTIISASRTTPRNYRLPDVNGSFAFGVATGNLDEGDAAIATTSTTICQQVKVAGTVVNLACITSATGATQVTGVTQASLGTPANGTLAFCTDCTSGSAPCTSGGSGAFAFRQNGAWKCL